MRNTFFALISTALDDARLAHALQHDASYRRWLHDDAAAALRVFDAGRPSPRQRNEAHEPARVSVAA